MKVYWSLIGKIQGADLVDMLLISIFINEFRFLLHAIDIFSKYAWFIPLKNKKSVTITNVFPKKEMSLTTNQTKNG